MPEIPSTVLNPAGGDGCPQPRHEARRRFAAPQEIRHRCKIAVGVPTSGRAALLGSVLDCIRQQTRAPDRLLICASCPSDLADLDLDGANAVAVMSPRGLTRQRNAVLAGARDCDLLAFFDDDFLPHARYLESVEQVFTAHSDVVMVTGRVLADGILGPGLTHAEALRFLAAVDRDPSGSEDLADTYNGYGCNMSVRLSAVLAASLAFDEALPFYGWLEDVDFSRRLAPYGRIVRCDQACGVHLGAKSGRQSGVRLGYSQIANPLHLTRKGTLAANRAIRQIAKNVAMNAAYSLWPESYVDRRGRLRGNLLGAADLLMNRLDPMRVVHMAETASEARD